MSNPEKKVEEVVSEEESVRMPDSPAMEVVRDERDALILRKAPEAIFLKPVSGELTPLMHKAFNVILARAAEQGVNKKRFEIRLKDIVRDTNFTSRDMVFFRECLKSLNVFQVEWDIFANGKRKGWGVTTLLAEAEIVDGTLFCSFSEKVREQLLLPAVYQKLNLTLLAKFRTRTAMALYEACMRYATAPDGITVTRTWREWKDMLCGPNVKCDQWRYFHRDTLKPALLEIARLADDIEVGLTIHKEGRAVSGLHFKVTPKQQQSLDLGGEERNLFNHDLHAKLVRFGFTEKGSTELLLKYDEGRIISTAAYLEERMRKGQVKNPPGLFKDALKEGYGKAVDKPVNIKQISTSKSNIDPAVKERIENKKAAINAYFSMPEDDKYAVWERFIDQSGTQSSSYKKKGLDSRLVRDAFSTWLISDSNTEGLTSN